MERKQIDLNPGQQVACTTAAYGTPASVPQSSELRILYQECDLFLASKVQFSPISAENGTSQDTQTDSRKEYTKMLTVILTAFIFHLYFPNLWTQTSL